jgi:thiamine-phosphate pyrophosphorylase
MQKKKPVSSSRLVLRVLDANWNRAREGLRVCEEVARFVLEDKSLTRRFQQTRYALDRTVMNQLRVEELFGARSVKSDPGRPALRKHASAHRHYRDIASANVRRVQESLRVMEEFSRISFPRAAQSFASLRFKTYALEQTLFRRLSALLGS